MSYAILGAGKVGQALATAFARQGIEVAIASRQPVEALAPIAMAIGPTVVPKTLRDAIKAEIVFLAVPFESHKEVAKAAQSWQDKIVIDVTNAYGVPTEELANLPSSVVISQALQQEEVAQQARQQEARRIRQDREIERTHREREREHERTQARAAEAYHEWGAQWLRDMRRKLPRDVPPELRLEVDEVIRQELPDLYQTSADHAEDIVEATLRAAVEKALRPWRWSKEAEKAADESLDQLPLFAQSSWGEVSEWELRAKGEALAAIAALPETATFQQMIAAARAVSKRVAKEYEHDYALRDDPSL